MVPPFSGAETAYNHGVQTSAVEVGGTFQALGRGELRLEVGLGAGAAILLGGTVVEALSRGGLNGRDGQGESKERVLEIHGVKNESSRKGKGSNE